nr:hypothetical protein [Tanacetum cinerariifolium]
MPDDEAEPAELTEVIEVVTTAKLMTKVVTAATTTAATIVTAAPSATRPIFEKHFNSIVAFLEKGEKEIKEEASKMILLAERRYPLTRFTLDQMLNNVRLEVEEDNEVSLELLRFVGRQQQEGYRPE